MVATVSEEGKEIAQTIPGHKRTRLHSLIAEGKKLDPFHNNKMKFTSI